MRDDVIAIDETGAGCAAAAVILTEITLTCAAAAITAGRAGRISRACATAAAVTATAGLATVSLVLKTFSTAGRESMKTKSGDSISGDKNMRTLKTGTFYTV